MDIASKLRGRAFGFILLLEIATVGVAAGASRPLQFSFADTETEPVLTLTLGGGSSGATTVLRAYASGTAELETIWGGQVIERADKVIERAEMEEMLALIAFGGLLDASEETIREEMLRLQKSPGRIPLSPRDSPKLVVEFAVERIDEANVQPVEIRRSVEFQAPDVMAPRYPTIKALQTLARLHSKLLAIAGTREDGK